MANIEINSLKPNSHKYKAEQAKKKGKMKPIVERENVVSSKTSLFKKVAESFLPEDVKDVKSWLFYDILLPGAKDLVWDTIETMFWGGKRSRSKRGGYYDRTDYRSHYRRSSYSRNGNDDRGGYTNERVDCRNVIVRHRDDAEAIVEQLRNRIRDTGSASTADLFDLIDVPGKYTDNDWGWTDERDIGVRRVSSGFLIDVSEPKYIG